MAEQLTKLESSVYHYLLDFTAENTYQPSIRDIGKQFKIKSTKTVSDLLQSLAKLRPAATLPQMAQMVKTSKNLLGCCVRRLAQLVRALPSHGRGQRFEPASAYHPSCV